MTNIEAINILKDLGNAVESDITKEVFSKAIEALEKENASIWIHRPVVDPVWERKFEEIEKALGFPLFIWQKTYIMNGVFRQYGETTARILRDLLDVDGEPLDYTKPPCSKREAFYREDLHIIKEQLNEAGIKTRPVFFCAWDKKKWEAECEDPYAGTPWSDLIMSKYR